MTDDETDRQLPVEAPLENAASAPARAVQPPAQGDWLRPAGVVAVLLGLALAAAPHVPGLHLPLLSKLALPELCGGLVVTAGLGLAVASGLRRSLRTIRGSLDELGDETARLDGLACDTRVLCESLLEVQVANGDLKSGVAELHKRIERLTEIASDPEHTVSMFRLAASVDQLGARLDLFIKDQFKTMRQQLVEVGETTQQAEKRLGARLGKLLEEQSNQAAKVGGALERKLAEIRAVVGSSMEALELERQKSAAAQELALDELGKRIELRLQEQTTYVAECLGQLDGSVERAGRERDELSRELSGRLEQQLAEHNSGLQQGLVPLAAAATRSEQNESSLLTLLSELEAKVAAQHKALQRGLQEGLDGVQTVAKRNGATAAEGLQATARLEARVQECQGSLERACASTREDVKRGAEAWKSALGQLGGAIESKLEAELAPVAGQIQRFDGALEHKLEEQLASVGGQIQQLDGALERRLAEQLASVGGQVQRIDGTLERKLDEQLSSVADQIRRIDSALEHKLEKQSASVGGQIQRLDGALGHKLEEQISSVAGQLQRLDGALEHKLEEQLAAVGLQFERMDGMFERKLEQQLATVWGRLEQLAGEVATLANLAAETRARELAADPRVSAREVALGAEDLADQPVILSTPCAIVVPDVEPPPALPSVHDTRQDIVP